MDTRFVTRDRTWIMGILNVTLDSFSGDGLLNHKDAIQAAVAQARAFVKDGADLLDVGGESTRPGAQPVNLQEELDRVIPVIEKIHAEMDITLSVDTYKSEVAEAAILAGASWVNDVRGLRADPLMAAVVAKAGVPVVIMHNRSKPTQAEIQDRLGGRYIGVEYQDLIGDVKKELLESVEIANMAGIESSQIILDPGIGFGKTVNQNLELINRLDEIKALGFPILLGPSRKSFIGYTLDTPADERLEGTLASCVVGVLRGADILRVHDVKAVSRVARMTDAILKQP
jgi:dihydropteroate synthase